MEKNYELISKYTTKVQDISNKKAGINIAPQKPEINQDRINNLVDKICEYEDFEKGKFLIDEPIVNFSQAVVDDSINANADFLSKAGFQEKIIRKQAGNCCKWCANLVGTYNYPDEVPKDVWRRHRFCKCTLDHVTEKGSKNVNNDWNEEKHRKKRIEFSDKNDKKHRSPLDILKEISIDNKEKEIYNLALSGKRHGGIYKDGINKNKAKLEKSIRSHYKQVLIHQEKIDSPHLYISDWDKKSKSERKGLIRKWEKDKKRNSEQAIVEIKIWEERFNG